MGEKNEGFGIWSRMRFHMRFRMSGIHWMARLTKSLKIAAAAFVSIALAGELGLNYSSTAGIITILSIRNTKRESVKAFNGCRR